MLAQGGRIPGAIQECKEAVKAAEGGGLTLVAAETKVRIADMLAHQGDVNAEEVGMSALQSYRNEDEREGQAYALTILANNRYRRGDFQGALKFASEAAPFYADGSDPIGQSSNLRTLGNIYARLGEFKMADSHYERAGDISRSIMDKSGEAQTLNAQGWSKSRQGDSKAGLALFLRALELARAKSIRALEAEILSNMGRELTHQDIDGAIGRYREALAIYRDINDVSNQGRLIGMLRGRAASRRDYSTALE
jgi:tetratricopeptide (TPR) repeat protein